MEFTIIKQDFAKSLSIISRNSSQRPNLPVLANLLIEAKDSTIRLSATNLEIGISLNINAKVISSGKTTVPAKILFELISSLGGEEINCALDNQAFKIKSNKSSTSLTTIDPAEFPSIPKSAGKETFKIGAEKLAGVIFKTTFASAIDESRPILTGVLIESDGKKVFFVATDGYRLSFSKLDIPTPQFKTVIPSRVLSEVGRIAKDNPQDSVEVFLANESNQIIFKFGKIEVVSRLIEGEYPNWQKIIPESFTSKAQTEKDSLLESIKLSAIFAKDSGNVIKLKFEKDRLIILANTKEIGEHIGEIPTKLDGPGGEIAFNYRYLIEILSNIES